MRICRKIEAGVPGPYVSPPAEEVVQGQGYPGIWSNHGATIYSTEAPTATSAPTDTPAPAASEGTA